MDHQIELQILALLELSVQQQREILARLPAPDRSGARVLVTLRDALGDGEWIASEASEVIEDRPGCELAAAVGRWLGRSAVSRALLAKRLPDLVDQPGELVLRQVGEIRGVALYRVDAVECGPTAGLGRTSKGRKV